MRPTLKEQTERRLLHQQGLRFCPSCKQKLPLTSFGKYKYDEFGLQGKCRSCTNAKNREYAPNMSEVAKEKRREYTRKWRENLSEDERKRIYKSRNLKIYGLTLEQFEKLLEIQGQKCALCHEPLSVLQGRQDNSVNVDHDHTTGKVRALLHQKCNNGLGCYDDNPALLAKAIEYLRRYAA